MLIADEFVAKPFHFHGQSNLACFHVVGEILSPRFKITASVRSFDVALEGRSSGTGGSFGFYTSTRMDQRFMDFE